MRRCSGARWAYRIVMVRDPSAFGLRPTRARYESSFIGTLARRSPRPAALCFWTWRPLEEPRDLVLCQPAQPALRFLLEPSLSELSPTIEQLVHAIRYAERP